MNKITLLAALILFGVLLSLASSTPAVPAATKGQGTLVHGSSPLLEKKASF